MKKTEMPFTTPKGTVKTPFRLHSISSRGVVIETAEWTEPVTWEKLEYCAAIGKFAADRDQADWYAEIRRAAQEWARHKRPVSLAVAEVATNLWGVVGVGVDGVSRPIRAYEGVQHWLRADEGQQQPQRWMAEDELAAIQSRETWQRASRQD